MGLITDKKPPFNEWFLKHAGYRNELACAAAQGCVWRWQRALDLTSFNRNTFKNIKWGTRLREKLDVSHPVKKMTC
jgi:hypothetical protein